MIHNMLRSVFNTLRFSYSESHAPCAWLSEYEKTAAVSDCGLPKKERKKERMIKKHEKALLSGLRDIA